MFSAHKPATVFTCHIVNNFWRRGFDYEGNANINIRSPETKGLTLSKYTVIKPSDSGGSKQDTTRFLIFGVKSPTRTNINMDGFKLIKANIPFIL